MSEPAKPSIVLVHGIWANASAFNKLILVLQEEGYEVVAARCGLETLAGDVAAVKRALRRVKGPTLLVGHSYGGAVITAAGMDNRVAGLVYLAGLAPNAAETAQSLQDKFPASDFHAHTEVSDGRWWLRPEAVPYFAGDLPERQRRLLLSTQAAPAADLFTQKVDGTAWATKPSWYVLAADDCIAHPAMQRFVAHSMGASLYETKGGHTAMLSNLDLLLAVIRDAAGAVTASRHQTANAVDQKEMYV